MREYLEEIEFNPKRLDEVEERLDLIHTLTRKYGGSIPAVIAYGKDARKQLEMITGAVERIEGLELEEATLLDKLARQGGLLSEKRKSAATAMGQGNESELNDLRMSTARFRVDFQTKPDENGVPLDDGARVAFDHNGFDRLEFFIAPNPGEGFKPLVTIASGGETSRLMLGLKNVLARADEVPSLIFDEIDQGIGGRVGLTVGQKLWNLSRLHQVFCVTHLPQLAFGDQHYQVQKLIKGNRTLTRAGAPGRDTTATRRRLAGFDPDVAAESFGIAPDGSRLVVAGWVQLFSLMEGDGLPGLLAPPRGRP